LSAIWGFGRIAADQFTFGIDAQGKALLALVNKQTTP
jgi:hypothetical protein